MKLKWRRTVNNKYSLYQCSHAKVLGEKIYCSKVILDSLEEASGVNDRDMRWQDGDVTYSDEPRLVITITESSEL